MKKLEIANEAKYILYTEHIIAISRENRFSFEHCPIYRINNDSFFVM